MRWEYARGALVRPAQVASQSGGVLLLVAIQHFHAGGMAKALITGSVFFGLLLSPLAVGVVARRGMTAGRGLALILAPAGIALALAALTSSYAVFLAGVLVGAPLIMAASPLVTTIWEQNIRPGERGRRFSYATTLAALAGIASTAAVSWWLDGDAARYRPVIVGLGVMLVLAAAASLRIPSGRVASAGQNPLRSLSLLWRHPMFGALNGAWTLLGLGNLITVPLRTEYLATGHYGLAYSAGDVVLLTVVLPQVGLLVSTQVWGHLFDHVRFLPLRIGINLFFIASIAAFFQPSWPLQVLGSLLYGMAEGGGAVAWTLWVTRFAPPGETTDFMAVHTFLTGVRGIAAPLLTYAFLGAMDLMAVNAIGVALLVAASVLLAAVMPYDRGMEAARA